ncbi:MAG: sigma-70 family RNA polymerase sigma factor [Vicinamibacterales bacterium]|jgi:RNA polymerase sigma factor (sigma-70 family)
MPRVASAPFAGLAVISPVCFVPPPELPRAVPPLPLVALTPPSAEWSDARLVQACLDGNQRAWDLLIARYKNLIWSFPRKYGAPAHEAADVFQMVCIDLFLELPRLRNHESLRAWISTVATRRAYHWKRRHIIRATREDDGADPEVVVVTQPSTEFQDAERGRLVRHAVAQLPQRYRAVIELLFFEEPPLPYQKVAQRLGVAPGSVSFLRARGLRKLERILNEADAR